VVSLAAFLVALVSLVFELFPLGEVSNQRTFALKVLAAILATNAAGAGLYLSAARRRI